MIRRAALLTAPAALLLLGCISLPPAPLSVKLFDGRNRLVGFVDIIERKPGVRFMIHTRGLPPGPHGFHIHVNARCEGPDFESAGLHLNPEGKQHGAENPAGFHAGDLPNVALGAEDWADTTIDWPHVRLDDGPSGLFRNGGTSLVIHEAPDDGVTDPAGNSGRRIACGVIVKQEEERF